MNAVQNKSAISKLLIWPQSAKIVAAILVLIGASIAGGIYGAAPAPNVPSEEMANTPVVRDFVKALELIEENYIVAPDKERLTRGALSQMLHSLDPHSNFFDRRDFNEMQDEQSSRFYGIGVTINQRNGRIYVIGVNRGMPAERAGLRYGDAIISVDGHSTKDWTQSDALKYVRGEKGTEVEISVERSGTSEPKTVKIIRDEVPFPSVRNFFMIRPEIGYIGLTGGFNQETTEELQKTIDQLKKEGMTSLVLDLRRNPGGQLKQAVQVAETFLPQGTEIVSLRGRESKQQKQIYRSENTNPETMPMVVLINGETASASEIVAGAMQDRDRAWIVGEESFGKGLVQTVFRLRGGTGLTLTTAKYYTPSGRSIQREYNSVGFYDYFYSRRGEGAAANRVDEKSKRQTNASNTTHTQIGREVEGGGGIKPDTIITIPDDNIRIRDACFEFTRLLAFGVIPDLPQYKIKRTEYDYHLRGNEYQLNDQVISAFNDFIRERPALQVSEKQLSKKIEYIRRRIRAELITAAYGIEVAEQFLIESDEQALRAVDEIPKAKHLNDQAKLFRNKS